MEEIRNTEPTPEGDKTIFDIFWRLQAPAGTTAKEMTDIFELGITMASQTVEKYIEPLSGMSRGYGRDVPENRMVLGENTRNLLIEVLLHAEADAALVGAPMRSQTRIAVVAQLLGIDLEVERANYWKI